MNYSNLNPQAFKEAIAKCNNFVVLDVRTPREVAEGIIKDAIIIDFLAEGFEDKVKNLNQDIPYFVYCRSGHRSGQACQLMANLGFKHLANLDGGILAWNQLENQ